MMSDIQYDKKYVILGIDPGEMTGLFRSIYTEANGNVVSVNLGYQFDRNEVMQAMNTQVTEWSKLFGPENVHVAVERYIITKRTASLSQQPAAMEITGAVKGFAELAGVEVKQYLKANLKYANDDMLRTMGWYKKGHRHANDAARQASALLKEVDYPRWCELVKGGTLDTTTKGHHDD
jgi:hypothetical protein